MASATARWTVTMVGGSSASTVIPPSTTSTPSSAKAIVIGATMRGSRLYLHQAIAAVARISVLVREAASRWEYSISASNSIGGNSLPWHRGQSGQPRPESVTLTTPPKVTREKTATAEAMRSIRKARLTVERRREGDLGALSAVIRVVSGCTAPWCRLILVAEESSPRMPVRPVRGARCPAVVVLKIG